MIYLRMTKKEFNRKFIIHYKALELRIRLQKIGLLHTIN